MKGVHAILTGIVLFVLGGIYFKLLFSDMLGEITPNSLLLVVILSGGGFVLIIYGEIRQQKEMKYLRYSTIIDKLPGDSLDEIAAAYPKSNEEVCKDLQEMIEKGFFPGCHLDLKHRTFVSPEKKKSAPVEDMTNKVADQPTVKAKVVQCPNCGAMNTLQGGASQCEYCDSRLV